MACCLTAPSHYLNQCWLTPMAFVALAIPQHNTILHTAQQQQGRNFDKTFHSPKTHLTLQASYGVFFWVFFFLKRPWGIETALYMCICMIYFFYHCIVWYRNLPLYHFSAGIIHLFENLWHTWQIISPVLKKAVKLNHSLTWQIIWMLIYVMKNNDLAHSYTCIILLMSNW